MCVKHQLDAVSHCGLLIAGASVAQFSLDMFTLMLVFAAKSLSIHQKTCKKMFL